MLSRIKKLLGFGDLVDEARKGNLSRRGFLQAALAIGVGPSEATAELGRRIYAVPAPVIVNPWESAVLGEWYDPLASVVVAAMAGEYNAAWNAKIGSGGSRFRPSEELSPLSRATYETLLKTTGVQPILRR